MERANGRVERIGGRTGQSSLLIPLNSYNEANLTVLIRSYLMQYSTIFPSLSDLHLMTHMASLPSN